MINKSLDGMLMDFPVELAIKILKKKEIGAKVRIRAWNWCGVYVKCKDGVTLETDKPEINEKAKET